MHYKLTIDETGRNSLKEEAELFFTIKETFATKEDVQEYIIVHYGKMPNGKNKIYIGEGKEIGFLHSYWVKGYGNEKSWYQTDWITIEEITTKTVLL